MDIWQVTNPGPTTHHYESRIIPGISENSNLLLEVSSYMLKYLLMSGANYKARIIKPAEFSSVSLAAYWFPLQQA
jgi:hypothetical protein